MTMIDHGTTITIQIYYYIAPAYREFKLRPFEKFYGKNV